MRREERREETVGERKQEGRRDRRGEKSIGKGREKGGEDAPGLEVWRE